MKILGSSVSTTPPIPDRTQGGTRREAQRQEIRQQQRYCCKRVCYHLKI